MNSERWLLVQRLFETALATRPEERTAFLASACGDDRELHRELTSLLVAHERSDDREDLPTLWLGPLLAPKHPGFEPGAQIAGRYAIRDLLGRGGMGEVYEAWDGELGIPVALKTLHLAGHTDEARRRLKVEGFLARAIWHPNVCRFYDLGRHGEGASATWFLTMELLRGQTLQARLAGGARLPLDRVLQLAQQMAAGIGAAHQAGVVHRDFKPSNVILADRDGGEQAVVTDFGVARALAQSAAESEPLPDAAFPIIGTPAYMAPEQLCGEEAGPRADIYALGMVLYEMVTGRLPFAGGSPAEVIRQRLVEEVPPPGSLRPDLEEPWEAVILRCLARDPARRFARAEEIGAALAGRLDETTEISAHALRARHTLPGERDDFVGRRSELQALARHLGGDSRLVTLVGAGGMGKTRLAIHFGWERLADWPGGVWFCDLTEATDVGSLASAVARSLGIQLGQGDPFLQIGHAIAGRGRCLVILDNFEQVTAHAAASVGAWLLRAPEARFLITSRAKLGLSDRETVVAVEPLPIADGMVLFASRAQRLRPGLAILDSDGDAVRELVRSVDGMPLAIELAGARLRVMSVPQIVAQMRARFRLLTGGGTARHETLEIAIDGSWELLTPWEQDAWAQCSVFEGGFTLSAAESVVDLSGWSGAPWVVDVIQSLVDKSLLRTWILHLGNEPETRFGMYVSLQEYARGKLRAGVAAPPAIGAAAERAAEERHGRWYGRHGALPSINALDQSGGQRRQLERDLGNIVAACRRAMARGDAGTATTVYHILGSVLTTLGPVSIALDLGHELIAMPLDRRERAIGLTALGTSAMYAGRPDEALSHFEAALATFRDLRELEQECSVLENLAIAHTYKSQTARARACCEAGLAISREIGNRRSEGGFLGALASVHRQEGQMEEARRHYEGALAIHREVNNRRLEGVALGNLGILHYDHGRLDEAQAHLEAALVIHREVGNRNSEGVAIGNLGNLCHDRGQLEEARRHYEAALAIHREIGHRRFEGVALHSLGALYRTLGQTTAARSHLEAALAIFLEVGGRRLQGNCLSDLGNVHQDTGEPGLARARYAEALAIHREVRDPRSEGITLIRLGSLLLQQGEIEAARQMLAAAEVILRGINDLIELGKLLCARAELECRTGNRVAAGSVFAEAQALADRMRLGQDSDFGRALARARAWLSADGLSSEATPA